MYSLNILHKEEKKIESKIFFIFIEFKIRIKFWLKKKIII